MIWLGEIKSKCSTKWNPSLKLWTSRTQSVAPLFSMNTKILNRIRRKYKNYSVIDKITQILHIICRYCKLEYMKRKEPMECTTNWFLSVDVCARFNHPTNITPISPGANFHSIYTKKSRHPDTSPNQVNLRHHDIYCLI